MRRALFVSSNLNNGYQCPIYEGLCQFACAHDIQLFTYALTTATPDIKVQKYLLRQLPKLPKADVLIINAATFEFIDDSIDYHALAEQYGCQKLIIIGQAHSQVCSINISNASGIRQCVDHLVNNHGFHRLGFIGGPSTVKDAIARKRAFETSMAAHQLKINPAWVVAGQFTLDAGYQAISALDSNNLPQAIVCADDYIALGASKAIQDLGYDIQLTGFDNVEQAQYATPPLTTIHQPLFEMGVRAGKEVLTPASQENILIEGELIIRTSCGCNPNAQFYSPDSAVQTQAIDAQLLAILKSRLALHKDSSAAIAHVIRHYLDPEHIALEELVDAWMRSVFISAPNYYALLECNAALTEYCIEQLSDHNALDLILEQSYQVDAYLHKQINNQYNRLLNIRSDQFSNVLGLTRDIDTSTTLTQLVRSFEHSLTANNIHHYQLALTTKRSGLFFEISNLTDVMRIVSSSVPFTEADYPIAQSVASFDHWPADVSVICILPLILDRFYFGQLLIGADTMNCDIIEQIRHNLAVALLSHSSIEQSRHIRQELENTLQAIEAHNEQLLSQTIHDELTGLYNRRGVMEMGQQRLAEGSQYLYFGDMDELKTINDHYGHHVGDEAICFVAQAIREVFGSAALCGRIGGDEFVVICRQHITHLDSKLAKQLKAITSDKRLPYRLGISFGVASTIDSRDLSELMTLADQRQYQQKQMRRRHG